MGALHLDSWQNVVTGLGTLQDKLRQHVPVLRPQLTDSSLEALHTDDDICARIIEQLPNDALRNGFNVALAPDQVADAATIAQGLDKALAALGAEGALREAWIWARLYGFGAVYLGADDGLEPDEPLELARVKTLTHLTVLRRPQLQQDSYYDDVTAPNYGQVRTYRVLQPSAPPASSSQSTVRLTVRDSQIIVHASRLLVFRGVLTSRNGVQTSAGYWDDSVLQRVYQAVQASSSSWMSVAHLMTDASQGVLKITNLMQLLTAAGQEKLRQRVKFMDLCRSVARAILIDSSETFERVPTPFTGIPELLDRFMMRVASAAQMPVTVLFGRSPAGLNATGESDMRLWYDQVAAERSKKLTPPLEQLVRVIMATDKGPTGGKQVDGFTIGYPPLWQPTAKERSETLKTTADALATLANAHIILPEEGAIQLAKCGEFEGLDIESREASIKYQHQNLAEPLPDGDDLEPDLLGDNPHDPAQLPE